MVRDGRPFDAGTASTAQAVPPPPNTLGGVVRAALGRDVARIVGPIVDTPNGPVFPAPKDVVRDGPTVRRLKVGARFATAVTDLDFEDHQRLSHHLVGEGDPMPDWISHPRLADWLTGAMPGGQDVPEPPRADPPWVPETRLGLARHWSGPLAGTGVAGLLYAMTQLRPCEGTRFLIGCVDGEPVQISDSLVPLGGRGRLAEVAVVTDKVLPDPPEDFPGGRLAVYLATPALLRDRWWSPPEAALSAVAIPGPPQPVASACPGDGFAGSRLLAWAVPAGSVFFLTFVTAEAARHWADRYHGGLLPDQSQQRIVTAGFGTCLTGRW
ncbi:MAG: type III-B CRISPR module-associated Cmr3 family protein [Pseudonocardiaceae bacterium]